MALLVFSHANSFPAGTYSRLFQALRQRGFRVEAIERFGHDARYPVSNNWTHLVQQLLDFVRGLSTAAGEPAWLVGHSFGGFASVMAAARAPELARGVVLLDSPLLGGWRATTLGVFKRTQLVGAVSPGAVSRRRRDRWPDRDAALAHFQHKKAFARWDPQVLQDYIDHGTRNAGQGRELCFERTVETAIYNTLPDNLDRLLRRHPLRCPAAFIGGTHSAEMRQVGMAMTEKVVRGRIMMLEGSHLFPMEQPLATAAAVEAAILGMTPRET